MTKLTPTMIEVLTPQVVLVENTIHCSTECQFMRIIQDEHTLEYWRVCVLGSPIISLKRVDNLPLYERTDACKEAEISKKKIDEYNGVAEMAWNNGDNFR
ncbi:MAG: hypothetical protein PHS57_10520 [Alphaproteobacteria bacterium]|nr:hypothetical protein [Alphaproteobacteria bacterium]